jgi:hypothetical protein
MSAAVALTFHALRHRAAIDDDEFELPALGGAWPHG